MKKYCKFLKDIYCDKELVWETGKKYLITHENKNAYFFSSPIREGIGKDSENINYFIIEL
jgi:hypothetical protein